VTAKDEAALTKWLSWLIKDKKQIASLKLSTTLGPALLQVERSAMTRKQKDTMMAKLQAEATHLHSAGTHHSSPTIKGSSSLPIFKPSSEVSKNCAIHAGLTGSPSRWMA